MVSTGQGNETFISGIESAGVVFEGLRNELFYMFCRWRDVSSDGDWLFSEFARLDQKLFSRFSLHAPQRVRQIPIKALVQGQQKLRRTYACQLRVLLLYPVLG